MKPNFNSTEEFIDKVFTPYDNFIRKINVLNKIIKVISFGSIPSYFRVKLSLGITSLIVTVNYGAYYYFEKQYKIHGITILDDSVLSEHLDDCIYTIKLGHNSIDYIYNDYVYRTNIKEYNPNKLISTFKRNFNNVKEASLMYNKMCK